ncbi:carboxymuconolactone decarboxylase family protein [Roseomonas sp. BN140053]|uniref:carboxymuconolactone decarboxylase family protein n=1 Tax=Roseomonas sp. BN140053 TaxID=3391898 RepID=UPI0039E817CE
MSDRTSGETGPGPAQHAPADADTAELERRLEAVRAKRGYLLPHHGLMALSSPELLAGYDAAYTAMALRDRTLSHHDREFVWLAVLAATDEALATHHIAKFRGAGGTDETVAAAFAACAWALGGEAHDFAARAWARQLAPWDPRAAYLDGVRRLSPLRLVHLAQCAVHVCRARWRLLEWQLAAAYADAVPEDEIAEALSLAMFPGSVPRFVEACGVWRDLIAAGTLPASPRYLAWARLTGQGGFDEATGLTPAG